MSEFTESDIEEIVAQHPEIIEKGLTLKERQGAFRGKRVDLIFADRFGDTLIVELKKGVAKREHVAQLADYMGLVSEQERGRIRIMLIASVIPPYLKSGLDRFGLEYREITDRDYIEFLKEKNLKLFEEFQKKQLQPTIPPEGPKERVHITSMAQVETEQLTDEQIITRISEVLSYKIDLKNKFAQVHPFIVHSRLFVYYRHNTESIKEEYRNTYKNNFSRLAEYRDTLNALRKYMNNFKKADYLALCIYNAKTHRVETLSSDNAQIHRILAIQ